MNITYFNPKIILKQILKYCLIIISGIFIGFFLLVVVYALPVERMKEHARKSVDMLTSEGDYPKWADGLLFTQRDQFTDSVMIKTAVLDADASLIEKALLLPYIGSKTQVSSISDTLENEKKQNYKTYARYWEGYLLILKPLLLFFTVQEIRIFSLFSLGIMSCIAVILIRDRLGIFFTFAFFITVLFLNPISIVLCMSFQIIYYIAMITIILILLLEKKKVEDKHGYIFLVDGICVAFFDFLTYPIIALCLPLIVYTLLYRNTLKGMIASIMKRSFLWLIGYGTMWCGKWVLASILTDQNVINDGINTVLYRASAEHKETKITFSEIVKREFNLFDFPVFRFLGIAILVIILIYWLNKRKFNLSLNCIPFLIISAFPFLWYAFVKNHSFIHQSFVYRGLGGTLFGLFCFIGILLDAD